MSAMLKMTNLAPETPPPGSPPGFDTPTALAHHRLLLPFSLSQHQERFIRWGEPKLRPSGVGAGCPVCSEWGKGALSRVLRFCGSAHGAQVRVGAKFGARTVRAGAGAPSSLGTAYSL